MAASTTKRTGLRLAEFAVEELADGFARGLEFEHLARPGVGPVGDGVEVVL
jgi:hypothetical protein